MKGLLPALLLAVLVIGFNVGADLLAGGPLRTFTISQLFGPAFLTGALIALGWGSPLVAHAYGKQPGCGWLLLLVLIGAIGFVSYLCVLGFSEARDRGYEMCACSWGNGVYFCAVLVWYADEKPPETRSS